MSAIAIAHTASFFIPHQVLFSLRKQQFLELLEKTEDRPELPKLVQVLKGLEGLCTQVVHGMIPAHYHVRSVAVVFAEVEHCVYEL